MDKKFSGTKSGTEDSEYSLIPEIPQNIWKTVGRIRSEVQLVAFDLNINY